MKFADWFHSSGSKNDAPVAVAEADAPPASTPAANVDSPTSLYATSTGDDYEEFRLHLCGGKRPFRKPGISVRQEYELWLAHRAKTRTAADARGTITAA